MLYLSKFKEHLAIVAETPTTYSMLISMQNAPQLALNKPQRLKTIWTSNIGRTDRAQSG